MPKLKPPVLEPTGWLRCFAGVEKDDICSSLGATWLTLSTDVPPPMDEVVILLDGDELTAGFISAINIH